MTHPDLVEELRAAAKVQAKVSERTTPEWRAADLILTLQSSLAEQEKTISKLREEVKEARGDYLRRHNDAANAFEEIAVLQSHLAEASARP